ncbi:hypothetical protein Q5752_001754 [Cryptotrichosporon argae]
MRIDGIIIIDPAGRPLITSNFPAHPPSYPSIHIDAFNHALRKARDAGAELEPVIWVNALARVAGEASASAGVAAVGAGLCHVERDGVRFLVPVAAEVNPLYAFAFLDTFLNALGDYLGEVTETAIKDNFDIVYMLIEEMLDEGHPMTTETAMLKEIVLPPTLMRKLLNAAGVANLQAPTTSPFTAPIPWRRQGVRHNKNEIFFDIVETLDAIVDAYNKWSKDGILSFIPPDGRFKLLEYETAPAPRQLPFSLKATRSSDGNGGRFSLTLTPRVRLLDDIVVTIPIGVATSVTATVTGDRPPLGQAKEDGQGHVAGGVWEWDPHAQVVRWTLSSVTAHERPPTLAGSYVADAEGGPAPAVTVSFAVDGSVLSGLKVDQLRVLGDVAYKPFKGSTRRVNNLIHRITQHLTVPNLAPPTSTNPLLVARDVIVCIMSSSTAPISLREFVDALPWNVSDVGVRGGNKPATGTRAAGRAAMALAKIWPGGSIVFEHDAAFLQELERLADGHVKWQAEVGEDLRDLVRVHHKAFGHPDSGYCHVNEHALQTEIVMFHDSLVNIVLTAEDPDGKP